MKGNYFYRRLGNRVTLERRRKKLSQEQLAESAEIDRTYLARIEEGKANPSIKVLNKISAKLKIKVADLLKGV
ncbi:MAG: helix-turn-helix transcriptional regulator [Candidatus Roizmanbacteria bacterium]|nr:MAG: helix-turn-helix transcriptional regulator [Candidatus Roizmanbacteria bacterium]